VEPTARDVLREDPTLNRPDTGSLGGCDEVLGERPSDTSSSCRRRDVHAVFNDSGVDATIRRRPSRDPSSDAAPGSDGHVAIRPVGYEDRPRRWRGLVNGRVTGGESFGVDPADCRPVRLGHRTHGDIGRVDHCSSPQGESTPQVDCAQALGDPDSRRRAHPATGILAPVVISDCRCPITRCQPRS
jgi:hypothetical protein